MAGDGSDVVRRVMDLMNAHDVDGMVALLHPDYRSEQPFHPARDYVGNAQTKALYQALFEGMPDLRAEIVRATQDGETTWAEWRWSGTTADGRSYEERGVVLSDVHDGLITRNRFFTEEVEHGGAAIMEVAEEQLGRRREEPHA